MEATPSLLPTSFGSAHSIPLEPDPDARPVTSRKRSLWLAGGLLMALVGSAYGAPPVSLEWDANPEPDVAGYRLHFGLGSGAYSQVLDVGAETTATVGNLASGTTYYFAVTAYTADGVESLPSEEVSFTTQVPQAATLSAMSVDPLLAGEYVPLGADPDGATSLHQPSFLSEGGYQFAIKGLAGQILDVYGSSDLATWDRLGTVDNPTGVLLITDLAASSARIQFYRALPAPGAE